MAHDCWRFEYTDWRGRRTTGTGYKSKRETEALAAKLEREAMEIRKGYREPPKSHRKHSTRPVAEVVAEYLDWGAAQGGRGGRPWGAEHLRKRRARLTYWLKELGLQTMVDLPGLLPRVEKQLRRMTDKRRSPKTLQNYAEALRAFCEWSAERGYLDANPLAGMVGFDTTPQTIRRAMTEDEIARLLEVAPEHRRLVYEVALCTGLRASELRALTLDHLDMNRCGLHLEAAWTKSRRAGFQHVPRALLNRLRLYADTGDAGRRYESRPREKKPAPANPLLYVSRDTATPFDSDCLKAGILKHAPGGKVDFHSLRTCYVNLVLATGCDAKTAQEAARHSSLSMTMNVYGRARETAMQQLAESVGASVLNAGDHAANPETCAERFAAGAESLFLATSCSDGCGWASPPPRTSFSAGFLLAIVAGAGLPELCRRPRLLKADSTPFPFWTDEIRCFPASWSTLLST